MKTLLRYRFLDDLKSLGILMLIMILIPALMAVFLAGSEMGGMTTLTGGVWAMVLGIVATRVDLRLGNQFGISRRSAFVASALANALAFLAGAAALTAYTWLLQILTDGDMGRFVFLDLYQMAYSSSATYVMPPWEYGIVFLLDAAMSLCLGFLGMLCTLAFWRLNKVGKWILGVGMGLGFFVGLPNLIAHASPWLVWFARILSGSAWAMMAFLLAWAALFLAGAWLLGRRIPILAAAK